MNHVFHRNARASYPVAAKGDGVYILDSEGKRYLDASGGAAVSCLGHSETRVTDAIKRQLDEIPFAHTGFFSNDPMEALADHLIARAPGDLDRVYFVSGGSEAIEAALKMARQYFMEIGQPERHKIIARRQSYHGNTLGALAVGGNEWRREQFKPLLIDTSHVSPCFAYRDRRDDESEEAYGQRVADELDAAIREHGPETVAAFVCEPVVGATLGAVPAVPGYLKRIREICDEHGVLLIFDEVMCGMGRTGYLYACEEDGAAPDLLTIAKGLGAGYQPIGATLVSSKIFDAIHDGSGFFQHGHTYMGHPAACAGALAVQKVIEEDNLLENVRAMGAKLKAALEERFGNHHHVGDIRGRGLFLGVELVEDRASKKCFDPARKVHAKVKAKAMELGLMCYPMGGTIDGRVGDHVLLAPPFIIDENHIEEIVGKLGEAIDEAVR
ncbi:aspartate aminotransferase family protein [Nisaea acidiphila]|uniref:Aspartate aminotransferase family protein n=1 Tax=Nisaea acidiphila TaxID=1862145 RepID=A0A9J7APY8_9PROT|nr:aspartate aminotransferase family protein [Nisaea acidiphila]UUX49464.1 aspartate aminotransferase family protein [Nisaea acidiphila]